MLIGTTGTIGSSLNLFQVPGSSFHISTLVRLTRPWVNVDDGDRLVGIGQEHQVKVITLVSTFRKETLARLGSKRTIEERLQDVLAQKKVIFRNVVDGQPIIDDEARQKLEAFAAEEMLNGKTPAKQDQAMKAKGGIDLTRNQVRVSKEGQGVQMQFDPSMIARIKREGFDGLEFQIQSIVPITNLPFLLGLESGKEEQLAGV